MKAKISITCMVLILIFSTGLIASNGHVLYESRTTNHLAQGVIYERNRMMTVSGMVDVHVLIIDLQNPHITLAPVTSSNQVGRRDTTSNMIRDAGAIAGINADFFGMAGRYSFHFGPMVRDGRVVATNNTVNANAGNFATFLLDENNNPFFRYIQTNVRFYNNSERNINIGTFNSIGPNLSLPAVVDRQVMTNTAHLDSRISGLAKIVVENQQITHVSGRGEVVDVPADGYIVLIPSHMYDSHIRHFSVGDRAVLQIGSDLRVDFSRIQTGIGGGGLILRGGETVHDAGTAPGGRHPRSAVGVTREGEILLMAVDGRGHSVGATHTEMAELLRHYNVVDAMHLDGGGSTTMVTSNRDGVLTVANRPSDGGQRSVINSLGVFNNAPRGQMARLILEMASNRAVVNVPLAARVFGEDDHFNRIHLDFDRAGGIQPSFIADNNMGFWHYGRYVPTATGEHTIEVRYGEWRASATFQAFALGELQPSPSEVSLLEGGRVRLSFTGVALDGTPVNIPELTGLSVHPSNLGFIENGYFHAVQGGTGYISAMVGAIRAYIPLSVGGFPWPVYMQQDRASFMGFPAQYVTGRLESQRVDGEIVHRLDYSISQADVTQAAYVVFDPPLEIPGNPIALRMEAYGDGSGHWMRARLRDADGRFHLIDFAQSADFLGWETVIAEVPDEIATPFTLDQIYMVTLGSFEESSYSVMFSALDALYAPERVTAVPQGTVFQDRLQADEGFTGVDGSLSFEFGVPTPGASIPYTHRNVSNFSVVTINTLGGGITSGGRDQWARFMRDARRGSPDYVVILANSSPLDFENRMEFELFHSGLTELVSEGYLVFVVSSTADLTTLHIRDGVRYINLPAPDQGITNINFWTENGRIWWRG